MIFLYPTGHEDLRGRRWPVVTIAIIVLNVLAFALTYTSLTGESEQLGRVKLHILILAALHPEVEMTPEVQRFVEDFQRSSPKLWEQAKSLNRPVEDEWDASLRARDMNDVGFDANAEMASLTEQYNQLKAVSTLDRYAFHPNDPTFLTYFTANFLHGGWLHIIFNMWFLWLAGSVLEDKWGRPLYAGFYLVGGVVGLMAHRIAFPTSVIPVIGASGAVSALMGAFLVRYLKTKIDFVLIYFLGFVPRFRKFAAPAWAMLPLWFLIQVFWALLTSAAGGVGVAYWSHIGGFLFGTAVALGLRYSGIEKKLDDSIESEVTWTAHPGAHNATELLGQNRLDEAQAELEKSLQEKPDLIESHQLLAQVHWRKQNFEAYRAEQARVFQLQVKAKELNAALDTLGDLRNSEVKIPSAEWIAICRHLESKQDWERAAGEYESFAVAYPGEKLSVYALVSAARIQLKQLNRRDDAARLYRAAQSSPIPHFDWDDAIRRGLLDATSWQ